jgi:hypothetical protein
MASTFDVRSSISSLLAGGRTYTYIALPVLAMPGSWRRSMEKV